SGSNSARTSPGIVSSTRPVTSSTTSTTRTTPTTLPTTSSTTTSTTVRPAVPSPEAAANGLWAAYSPDTKANASRFATQEAVHALFSSPYSGETGTFQGCTPRTR